VSFKQASKQDHERVNILFPRIGATQQIETCLTPCRTVIERKATIPVDQSTMRIQDPVVIAMPIVVINEIIKHNLIADIARSIEHS